MAYSIDTTHCGVNLCLAMPHLYALASFRFCTLGLGLFPLHCRYHYHWISFLLSCFFSFQLCSSSGLRPTSKNSVQISQSNRKSILEAHRYMNQIFQRLAQLRIMDSEQMRHNKHLSAIYHYLPHDVSFPNTHSAGQAPNNKGKEVNLGAGDEANLLCMRRSSSSLTLWTRNL